MRRLHVVAHSNWQLWRTAFVLLCGTVCLLIFVTTPSLQNTGRSRFCDSRLGSLAFSLVDACTVSEDGSRTSWGGGDLRSPYGSNLSIASAIYVISLPRRKDRRLVMDRLGKALQLNLQYWDALDKDDPLVDDIIYSLTLQRRNMNPGTGFSWVRRMYRTKMDFRVVPPYSLPPAFLGKDKNSDTRLLCAVDENTIPTYDDISTIPYYRILSRGMIACYYSHLKLMAHIVRQTRDIREETWNGRDGVVLILEDDVDVEWDIRERLDGMWSDLPHDWEVVMLGHCWSNEAVNSPLTLESPLHPSNAPKCTHAYAVSPRGARKLFALLTSSPLAFSRALDQALAHLVKTQRVKSFSVVPSIVVQRRQRSGSNSSVGGSSKSHHKHQPDDSLSAVSVPASGSEIDVLGQACGGEEGTCEDLDVVRVGQEEEQRVEEFETEVLDSGDSDIWIIDGHEGSRWMDVLHNSALERIGEMHISRSESS